VRLHDDFVSTLQSEASSTLHYLSCPRASSGAEHDLALPSAAFAHADCLPL